MPAPILATKLYIPSPHAKMVLRPRLMERLNEGVAAGRKLTLISAPAGFGKTTLLSEWIGQNREAGLHSRVAWLSVDEGDSELHRFLTYIVAALQTLALGETEAGMSKIGENLLAALQTFQPPPTEALLTDLAN